MAVSIDYGNTNVITIPQADLTLLGTTPQGDPLYELDVDWLRGELKALEAGEIGIAFPDTHRHVTETTVGITTYARFVLILAPYTVEITPAFAGQVACTGAVHNLEDVYINNAGPTLLPGNPAALVSNTSVEAIAEAVWGAIRADHALSGTFGQKLGRRQESTVVDTPGGTIIRETDDP